jgi:hypothetical protein
MILIGKPEGKKYLVENRRELKDNIRTNLTEISWGGIDEIGLAQDRDQSLMDHRIL